MLNNNGIHEGMTVRGLDGSKLGSVLSCSPSSFIVEKGLFFPTDYTVGYQHVSRIADDEVILDTSSLEQSDLGPAFTDDSGENCELAFSDSNTRTGSSLASDLPGTRTGEWQAKTRDLNSSLNNTGFDNTATERCGTLASQEGLTKDGMRIPVVEEELDVQKASHEAGEVQVRKEVITEHKQVTVPVKREEVYVERVPANRELSADEAACELDASFGDKTIRVPVVEEEVEIRKRPVVKEEVVIKKSATTEQRTAGADLRKERVDVKDTTSTAKGKIAKDSLDDVIRRSKNDVTNRPL